jgi:hypothetical protein
MSSEIIVVLVMCAFAVGFILWVRRHSQPTSRTEKPDAQESERETINR